MKLITSGIALLACGLLSGTATAQIGPDITVLFVGHNGGNTNDFHEYGSSGGVWAYSAGTTSCNEGDQTAIWLPPNNSNHPVIAQNLYRLKGGRFEQVGMSWLKHGFCAVNEAGCGACQSTPCSSLGLGCADTYWGTLNGSFGDSGPRSEISPTVGTNLGSHASPTGSTLLRGRLQVKDADIQPALNSGAQYFWEGHYIARDDHLAGNGGNNASWREVTVASATSVNQAGGTNRKEAGIFAWRDNQAGVVVGKVINNNEGGVGVHGTYYVGYAATDNGNGTWHYEYAIFNMNSDRSGGGFSVPIGNNVSLTNVGFNDVDYHSGESYSSTDWVATEGGGSITWATQDFSVNANANALRWSTMYSFRFDANSAPQNVVGSLELFKPGTPTSLNIFTQGPSDTDPEPGTISCFGDGTATNCPCFNFSLPGANQGCATTLGGTLGMNISGSGSTSIAADDMVLTATNVPGVGGVGGNTGIYFSGTVDNNPGIQLFDGLFCFLGSALRYQGLLSANNQVQDSNFVAQDVFGSYFFPGTTYNFQYLSRDNQDGPSPCGGEVNLTPLYSVLMTP